MMTISRKPWRHALVAVLGVVSSLASAQPVHHAVVAGTFYPGTKDSLLAAIEYCSGQTRPSHQLHAPPIGIIAPHAGYAYSGIVAASAFRAAERGVYTTAIILGPSHFALFNGVATTAHGTWETPLGAVAIDEARTAAIMQRCGFVRDSDALFSKEHSLETQVPLLQRTFPKIRIVPLEMGTITGEQYAALSSAIADLIDDAPGEILVVASSDLSHYHSDGIARRMDNVTLTDVIDGDLDRLVDDLNNRSAEMCGFSPVITMMLVAQRFDAQASLVAYGTTANATGDTSRVVGYSAVAFTLPAPAAPLSADDRAALLAIARASVNAAAHGLPAPAADNARRGLNTREGLFVTITKHGELRGCIGATRGTAPLWKAAADMGTQAACKDPRFTPLTAEELGDTRLEISVLSPMHRVRSPDEIVAGTHGLYIIKGSSSGLLLPQVAREQHWDRNEFLREVCIKAGLPQDAWRASDARLYTFTAEVFGEDGVH